MSIRQSLINAIIFVLIFYSQLYSKTINIPADFSTIQEGINASVNGDTILVQPGTYVENINFNGKNVILGSLFITTKDTSYISNTIIDGNNADRVVTFNNGETNDAQLSGFTIENGGKTEPSYNKNGGGIFCANSSPILSHLIIRNNKINASGGGIYLTSYNGNIINVIITDNLSSGDGGGLYANLSNFTLSESIISHNRTGYMGGGICLRESNEVNLNHLLLYKNEADFDGGGLYINEVAKTNIIQSTITENMIQGGRYGSGIMLHNIFSDVNIVNSIVYRNYRGSGHRALFTWSGTYNVAYSCIGESYNGQNWVTEWGGDANVYDYPNYVSFSDENYNLSSSSPCIEAGTNFYILNGDTLINYLDFQYYGTAPDMGFFQSDYINIHPGDTDNNGVVEANDILPIGLYFLNSGPIRNNANLGWNPQTTLKWNDVSNTYADANGDGVVDEKDVIGIGINWGNTHTMSSQNSSINISAETIIENKESFQKLYNSLRGNSEPIQEMKKILRDILDINVPNQFILFDNYPNPFNSSTIIKFDMPMSEQVSITLFNLLGEEVLVPIRSSNILEGTHKISINMNNLPAGIYYYQIKTDSFKETKKMVLMK